MTARGVAWGVYCVAHFGKSLLWAASDLLTLYVLVTLYAMDPVVAGALFLVALAANAIADLIVGIWLDRHPAQAATLATVALVVSAASFPATMLLAPHGAAAVLAAMLVFRIAYAGYDVPHNALMARLAPAPAQAAWLSRGRTIGTGMAGLVVAWGARSAGDLHVIAPWLYALAAAALAIGIILVPLLARMPLPTPAAGGTIRRALPLGFLAASVVGIVALGALAKAALHLPPAQAPLDAATTLILLTVGRTASALVPLRILSARRGFVLLATAYLAGSLVAVSIAWTAATATMLALGLTMGVTNLIGWAMLPVLARGAKGYGLYTMVSKLALGAAGLALAAGLGRTPVFTGHTFHLFAGGVALACAVAALLLWPGLTSRSTPAFSRP